MLTKVGFYAILAVQCFLGTTVVLTTEGQRSFVLFPRLQRAFEGRNGRGRTGTVSGKLGVLSQYWELCEQFFGNESAHAGAEHRETHLLSWFELAIVFEFYYRIFIGVPYSCTSQMPGSVSTVVPVYAMLKRRGKTTPCRHFPRFLSSSGTS